MKESTIDHHYYNTYYYSNIIDNILSGSDHELLGFISNFFDITEYSFVQPYQKFSAFHSFINVTLMDFFLNDMYEHDEQAYKLRKDIQTIPRLYAEKVMEVYEVDYPFKEFFEEDRTITYEDIEAYHEELLLTGYIGECIDKMTEEVFHILFSNRDLLTRFNIWVSYRIVDIKIDEIDDELVHFFTKSNRIKRKSTPSWVKKAVFFRDRGRCCGCNKDLSGTLSIQNVQHYDHIVPLKQGGINDVSNLQLLCDNCNQTKSASEIYTSNTYEKWF